MKRVIWALLLLFSIPAFAQYDKKPRIISRSTEVFNNTNCADTNTCDLIQIRHLVEDYEIFVEGVPSYGTRSFAWYTTDTMDNLENYAFVQFIKGCQYSSSDFNAQVGNVAREHFSEIVLFNHKNWAINSIDADPVYFSNTKSRHFYYKWNSRRGSISEDTEKFYGFEKPSFPELYVTDRPGTAFYLNNAAKNISLAFKICLYKVVNIPKQTSPDNVNFGTPIHCYYWYSSWVYNHNARIFEHPYEISPACKKLNPS